MNSSTSSRKSDALSRSVTAEDVDFFAENGYAVLRKAVDPDMIDALHQQASPLCEASLKSKTGLYPGVCHLMNVRWFDDVFRDWGLHGNIGSITQPFLRGKTVRLYQDALFGMHAGSAEYYTNSFHTESNFVQHQNGSTSRQIGKWGTFTAKSAAVQIWIPLQDVNPEVGGGLSLLSNFTRSPCHNITARYDPYDNVDNDVLEARCNESMLRNEMPEVTPRMEKGDVLIWHPWMSHKVQKVLSAEPGYVRFAWSGWLIDGEAISCKKKKTNVAQCLPESHNRGNWAPVTETCTSEESGVAMLIPRHLSEAVAFYGLFNTTLESCKAVCQANPLCNAIGFHNNLSSCLMLDRPCRNANDTSTTFVKIASVPRHWTMYSCANGDREANQSAFRSKLNPVTSRAAFVRCCSDSGCVSPITCAEGSELRQAEAEKTCTDLGYRLCRTDEVESGICCATGGLCDRFPIWTATQEDTGLQGLGKPLNHSCFPQVYPSTLQHEIEAHFAGDGPHPLAFINNSFPSLEEELDIGDTDCWLK